MVDSKIKCLKLLDQKKYLEDAEIECMNQPEGPSFLPLPANQKENEDYLKAFEKLLETENTYYVSGVALGLSDRDNEGTFVKIGQPQGEGPFPDLPYPTWTNWDVKSGEPNNYPPAGEDYVVMFIEPPSYAPYAKGMWNDYSGLDSFSVICVVDPSEELFTVNPTVYPSTGYK